MKIALIVNPYSGGKKIKKQWTFIKERLKHHHIDFTRFESSFAGHALKLASKLHVDHFDAIVSVGGDGTNFHVLNGLLQNNPPENIPPLGIIPVGSGNSFAKDLGIENCEQGIQSLLNQKIKKVDVCSFTQNDSIHYFVNLTGLGFVTEVAKTADRFKKLNALSYIIGVLYRVINLQFHDVELTIDHKTISGRNCFVEFCNSRYTGGNMLMAPDAEIDDGLMDIIITGPLSRFQLLKALPKIFKGTHIHEPFVSHVRAKYARITTSPPMTLLPDGEVWGSTPTEIRVHPKFVRYLT